MDENEEVVGMLPENYWADILGTLKTSYDVETDPEKKKQLFEMMLKAQDRLSKIEELSVIREKNELDNSTKKEMNKLDNETRLKEAEINKEVRIKEAEMKKSTDELKMALDAADTGFEILKVAGLGLGCLALEGAVLGYEADGFEPGKSTGYKIITDLGRKIIRF